MWKGYENRNGQEKKTIVIAYRFQKIKKNLPTIRLCPGTFIALLRKWKGHRFNKELRLIWLILTPLK